MNSALKAIAVIAVFVYGLGHVYGVGLNLVAWPVAYLQANFWTLAPIIGLSVLALISQSR